MIIPLPMEPYALFLNSQLALATNFLQVHICQHTTIAFFKVDSVRSGWARTRALLYLTSHWTKHDGFPVSLAFASHLLHPPPVHNIAKCYWLLQLSSKLKILSSLRSYLIKLSHRHCSRIQQLRLY
jgi:hypothetical protein